MSFYVDTQLEALKIAFSLVKRPDVQVHNEGVTNILDTEGKHVC